MSQIVILSNSPIKTEAFIDSKISDIVPYDSPFDDLKFVSFVCVEKIIKENNLTPLPPQPDHNSGIKCANMRIDYYKQFTQNLPTMIISIENYIDIESNFLFAYDKVIVVVEINGKRYEYSSTDVNKNAVFPKEFGSKIGDLDETNYAFSGYPITVGKVVVENLTEEQKKDHPKLYHNNWIKLYTEFDRVEQIEAVLDSIDYSKILKESITLIPNFPKENITFKNVLPLFSNGLLYQMLMNVCISKINFEFDYVVGLESRGFILGSALANKYGCGFVCIRKGGKLPSDKFTIEYVKEYGSDKFEIEKESIKPNSKILVVDDLLATGGTLKASKKLLKNFEPEFIKYLVIDTITECSEKANETLGQKILDNLIVLL